MNTPSCCRLKPAVHRSISKRRWRSVGGCAGSGALLILLPKCPLCIAAYLAVWTGLGIAAPIASYLRFALAGIFIASLTFLLMRRFFIRTGLSQRGGWKQI